MKLYFTINLNDGGYLVMNRPYVNLNSKNIIENLLAALKKEIEKLKLIVGVVGITLNGGLSRGYADHLSEIDIVIYLEKKCFENWHKTKTPLPLGIAKLGGYLYDIKIVDFESEEKRIWDSASLWDLSYSKILFDPEGKIEQLMKDKLSCTPKVKEAEALLFSAWWYFRLAADIWIHRGDALQCHYMLNKAVVPLLEALFIANSEYIPHEKWIVHMSRSLYWKPENWEDKLAKALDTGDLSTQSLISRQAAIESIWKETNEYLISKECSGFKLYFCQRGLYSLLKFLVDNEKVTIKEWESMSNIMALNYEPFYSIVTIDNEVVVLEKEKLLSIRPEDMYYMIFNVVQYARDENEVKAIVEQSN